MEKDPLLPCRAGRKRIDSSLRVCYVCIFLNPRLKMGGEKNDCIICSVVEAKYCSIFFLFLPHARTRRRFLLDFLLPLPRNICISFGNTIPFRPNKSLVSHSLPLEREEEQGGQRREGPSQHTGQKLFDRGGRGERSADRIEQMLIAYTCSRPLSGR